MADINEIISKEAIQGLRDADAAFTSMDKNALSVVSAFTALNKALNAGGMSLKEYNQLQKDAIEAQKAFSTSQKKTSDAEKEAAKAKQALIRDGQKRTDAINKEIAAEKEYTRALNLEVKSINDAKEQNKALTKAKGDLNLKTEEWRKKLAEYNQTLNQNNQFLKDNGSEAEKQSRNVGNYRDVWNGVKGSLALAGAAVAGVMGIIKGSQVIIQSSEALSDRWAKTTTGLSYAWDVLSNSLANADFSNLFSNLRNAIKLGEEYAEVLDLLEDKRRGASVAESKAQLELSELRIKMNDVNLTAKQRKEYAQQVIDIEQGLANERKNIAETDLKALTKTIVGVKQVSQADLEAFIAFKGTTEQKVALADSYNKKVRELAGLVATPNVSPEGVLMPATGQSEAYIKLNAEINKTDASIKSMANVLNKISPKEIEALTAKTVEYYNASANVSQVVENTMKRQNRLEKAEGAAGAAAAKAVEKQRDSYQLLTDQVQELESSMMALKIAGQQPSQDMIHELISKKAQIAEVKKEVEGLALGMMAVAGKGTKGINFGSGTDSRSILSTKGTGQGAASAAGQYNSSIFDSKGEATQFAIEGAQVLADTTFTILANADQAQLDLKLSNLEKEKEARLKNFKGTEAERAKIEAEYAKKEAKIKTEAAKKQKAANIIQAIMNTALAIGNALATGGAAAPALAIMAGITGAAQMAIIAATKIPAYAGGTLSTPHDFIVGEAGPEWMKKQRGGWELVTAPMLELNSPGTQIISAKETRRMMELGQHPGAGVDPTPAIAAMHKDIVSTIRGKREVHISASGRKVTEVEGNSTKSWANSKINWMN